MFTFLLVIHILVSIVMIAAVLLQVGKGASIGSTFGGSSSSSQTIFGSAGPSTMLAKITYTCAAVFMLTSLALTYMSGKDRTRSIMDDVPAATAPVAPPETPSAQPGAPQE